MITPVILLMFQKDKLKLNLNVFILFFFYDGLSVKVPTENVLGKESLTASFIKPKAVTSESHWQHTVQIPLNMTFVVVPFTYGP